jgi:hypothetical protein
VNELPAMKCTPGGIKTRTPHESENTSDSIRLSCESDSNDAHKSDSQPEKHIWLRISASRGITIDYNEEPENVLNSIRLSCQSDSNETDESDLQPEKHEWPRIATPRRPLID